MFLKTFHVTSEDLPALLGMDYEARLQGLDLSGMVRVVEIGEQEGRVQRRHVQAVFEHPWSGDRPMILISVCGFSLEASELAARYDDVMALRVDR